MCGQSGATDYDTLKACRYFHFNPVSHIRRFPEFWELSNGGVWDEHRLLRNADSLPILVNRLPESADGSIVSDEVKDVQCVFEIASVLRVSLNGILEWLPTSSNNDARTISCRNDG